jgi:hypothetical protein
MRGNLVTTRLLNMRDTFHRVYLCDKMVDKCYIIRILLAHQQWKHMQQCNIFHTHLYNYAHLYSYADPEQPVTEYNRNLSIQQVVGEDIAGGVRKT